MSDGKQHDDDTERAREDKPAGMSRRDVLKQSYSTAVVGLLFGTATVAKTTGCHDYDNTGYADTSYADSSYADSGYYDTGYYEYYYDYSDYYDYYDYYVVYDNYYAYAAR